MNILILYNETQTYTNTVYEHLCALSRYSKYKYFYCHCDACSALNINFSNFDAIALHYSVRLPFNQISELTAEQLKCYSGLKFLFIQDEYDNTHQAWYWIKRIGFQLVFTVVPEAGIENVYPSSEFEGVRFVSNLTGYVPEEIKFYNDILPASRRELMVGYRGRPLPIKYGSLGKEKVEIGKIVKQYCNDYNIVEDVEWSEEKRIYGPDWYIFMTTCRSMLGSESGSNVFDWDGLLDQEINEFRGKYPDVADDVIYNKFVKPKEVDGLMNQISPRVFEAIIARTALVMFEGEYSGIIKAGVHYISVKKDGSNLQEVFKLLRDDKYIEEMTSRAFEDVIGSEKYSYKNFVKMLDQEIDITIEGLDLNSESEIKNNSCFIDDSSISILTTSPRQAVYIKEPSILYKFIVYKVWAKLPHKMRSVVKPIVRRGKNILGL